jgi:thiamine biosynthesis lipoprotein
MRPPCPPTLTLVTLGLLLAAAVAGRTAAPNGAALERFEFSEPQMGVPFRVVFYAPDPATATNAARAVFARIRALNDVLSDYEFDSELSRLSRTAGRGETVPVSAELWTVLHRAQDLAQRTGGAFDITVGPCVSVWRRARRDREMPTPARLAAARAATGWQQLELDAAAHTARLEVPRMRLDLGGIAKGYAADEGLKVLAGHGITRALISGGGDLAVSAPPPGQPGWRIELPPLDAPGAPARSRFVRLQQAALATSGDVFQYVEIDGVRYSHIVDPRTGLGLTNRSLVTVIAPDGLTADSLSTAISVLGPEHGRRLARREAVGLSLAWQRDGTIETFANRRFRRWLEP